MSTVYDQSLSDLIADHHATCTYCRREGTPRHDPDGRPWTRDHVTPRSRGGGNMADNIVLACFSCNSKKRDTAPAAFALQQEHGYSRKLASHLAEYSQAGQLARYVSQSCWWLDVTTHYDGAANTWSVVLRLLWPREVTETLTTFSRADADAAMDRINATSDAYWRSV